MHYDYTKTVDSFKIKLLQQRDEKKALHLHIRYNPTINNFYFFRFLQINRYNVYELKCLCFFLKKKKSLFVLQICKVQ